MSRRQVAPVAEFMRLTLLVLPLSEIVPELVRSHGESVEVITHNQGQIWSFLILLLAIPPLLARLMVRTTAVTA
jgi:hypothetical protein